MMFGKRRKPRLELRVRGTKEAARFMAMSYPDEIGMLTAVVSQEQEEGNVWLTVFSGNAECDSWMEPKAAFPECKRISLDGMETDAIDRLAAKYRRMSTARKTELLECSVRITTVHAGENYCYIEDYSCGKRIYSEYLKNGEMPGPEHAFHD